MGITPDTIDYHARVRFLLLLLLALLAACKVKDPPPIRDRWTDSFDRDSIGGSYYATGDGYKTANGALSATGAKNHPMWLRSRLPRDVRIEFDCWSTDARGDIKVEVFGDGHSYDPDGNRYAPTGYEIIFGGWNNSQSMIGRLDEHDAGSPSDRKRKVVANQKYHWAIERRGKLIRWSIDGVDFLRLDDPQPLEGVGHDYFGFNNWESDTWFDNLVIQPL